MNIAITEELEDTKAFSEFKAGQLLIQESGHVIHIKTSDNELVNLATGFIDDSINPIERFVDVTDKFTLTNNT